MGPRSRDSSVSVKAGLAGSRFSRSVRAAIGAQILMNHDQLRAVGGSILERREAEDLRERMSPPPALLSLLTTWPIVGARISVEEGLDVSGFGVELQWMTPEQMEDEANETYPGIVAIKRGYFPMGICLEGSGDPYFYRSSDGAVVRIPHDAATETDLDEDRIELVAASVERLLAVAE